MGYKEVRRDQRYVRPPVCVRLGTLEFSTRNWSLGGFLLESAPEIAVGSLMNVALKVGDRADWFDVIVLALRRDTPEGTLACRFVNPPTAMVHALDRALAARLSGGRGEGRRRAFGAALAGVLMLAAPALAAGPGGALVPGGFALPEFHLNFPVQLAGTPDFGPGDLQISLTSPDRSVLQFLFSPRPQFAVSTDPGTGTSRSFAGLSWNLFENNGFYGNLGLTGSLTRPGAEDLYKRNFGPPLALHSTFEFGYQIGGQHSLTLSLDHATAPDPYADHSELNNLRLRYGLKF